MAKTGQGLVAFAQKALNEAWGYVWGTFGDRTLTEVYLKSKIAQYPKEVGGKEATIRKLWMGKTVADCVGLIKGYLWQGDEGKITYKGATDYSTGTIYSASKMKGTIATLPETPGIGLYMSGHVGVYIGGGYAIESKGTAYGVVKSTVKGRGWTNWFYVPGVDYSGAAQTVSTAPSDKTWARGSKEPDSVKNIQRALNGWGYKLTVDGSFGPATEERVKDFQRAQGIPVTGVVDTEKTWAVLQTKL